MPSPSRRHSSLVLVPCLGLSLVYWCVTWLRCQVSGRYFEFSKGSVYRYEFGRINRLKFKLQAYPRQTGRERRLKGLLYEHLKSWEDESHRRKKGRARSRRTWGYTDCNGDESQGVTEFRQSGARQDHSGHGPQKSLSICEGKSEGTNGGMPSWGVKGCEEIW